MLHTGDIYERRARAARQHDLQLIARAVSSFFSRVFTSKRSERAERDDRLVNDNGRTRGTAPEHGRAA